MSLQLTLSKSTVTFKPGTLYNIPVSAIAAVQNGQYTKFPVPWQGQSNDPGIQISITNNSLTAPIAPILMDTWVSKVDSSTYYYTFAEISTVMPGQTVTETVAGLPVTQMVLALMYLGIGTTGDITNGWTVNVEAWAV